jgi:hypothetical protein
VTRQPEGAWFAKLIRRVGGRPARADGGCCSLSTSSCARTARSISSAGLCSPVAGARGRLGADASPLPFPIQLPSTLSTTASSLPLGAIGTIDGVLAGAFDGSVPDLVRVQGLPTFRCVMKVTHPEAVVSSPVSPFASMSIDGPCAVEARAAAPWASRSHRRWSIAWVWSRPSRYACSSVVGSQTGLESVGSTTVHDVLPDWSSKPRDDRPCDNQIRPDLITPPSAIDAICGRDPALSERAVCGAQPDRFEGTAELRRQGGKGVRIGPKFCRCQPRRLQATRMRWYTPTVPRWSSSRMCICSSCFDRRGSAYRRVPSPLADAGWLTMVEGRQRFGWIRSTLVLPYPATPPASRRGTSRRPRPAM